jgi:hypothetical protein
MGTVATFAVTHTDPAGREWIYLGRVSFNAFGHYCGYLTVPADHGLFQTIKHDKEQTLEYMFEVHGGITYSEPSLVDGNWELGFDCAHSCDYRTGMGCFSFNYYPKAALDIKLSGAHRFRTRTYVLQQLEHLAQQIHQVQCEFIASQPS